MTTEKTLEILKKMKADPRAAELLKGVEKPKTPDEIASSYTQIARKLGYDLSETEMKEVILKMDADRKAKTEAAKQNMEALDDDDLENVAGGSSEDYCDNNFVDTDCWLPDACAFFNIIYFDCEGEYY